MNESDKINFKAIRQKSRKQYLKLNLPVFGFLILFGVFRDYIFIPLLGKIWGLALATTPDGFVSNANILNALVKSPWIIAIGLVLIIFYGILALWQISALITAIGYLHENKSVKLFDLIRISFSQIRHGLKPDNWMIILYTLIIVPLANIFQTTDMVSAFVIPEYISEFIKANTLLTILLALISLFITYVALRWFFVLPSFFFKGENFTQARKESCNLASTGLIKNGLHIILYSLIEFLRISILPIAVIIIPVSGCYLFTRNLMYASSLYQSIGINLGIKIIKAITGPLAQISIICFLVELYFEKTKSEKIDLPKLKSQSKNKTSFKKIGIILSIIFSAMLALSYLGTVFVAQNNSEIILDIFGRTEIIAHKGYSSQAPENTIPAFDLADKCKPVSYIELDVWTSQDGVPVVIHNETITAATGVEKNIYDCTYAELQNLPAPYNMSETEFADARIPSLEEVLAKYADSTPLLIEIKGRKHDPDLPNKIVKLMEKYNCQYTSIVHSGDYKALEEVKKANPNIKCGLILAMVTGNYYDLPYADFFSVEHTFINSNIVDQIQRRNKKIFAWTINFKDSAKKLIFSGVDGIITDYPDTMNSYFSATNNLFDEAITGQLEKLFKTDEYRQAIENFINGKY